MPASPQISALDCVDSKIPGRVSNMCPAVPGRSWPRVHPPARDRWNNLWRRMSKKTQLNHDGRNGGPACLQKFAPGGLAASTRIFRTAYCKVDKRGTERCQVSDLLIVNNKTSSRSLGKPGSAELEWETPLTFRKSEKSGLMNTCSWVLHISPVVPRCSISHFD